MHKLKKCLGLVFGMERFHSYVYGLPTFVAETDHCPLIAIVKKNLTEMTQRIQRLMMKLQRYDFDLVYMPRKYLVMADTKSTTEYVEIHVSMVQTAFPVSDKKSKLIAQEIRKDAELQAVVDNMHNGWPMAEYSKYREVRCDLSVVNGCF